MRVLLDTHLLLWAVTDDPALGEQARAILLNPDHQIHVSTASIWEVAIKHRKNPAVMPLILSIDCSSLKPSRNRCDC